MKKLTVSAIFVFCFCLFLSGQTDGKNTLTFGTNEYSKDWEKVSEMEDKALPKSALETVNAIFEKAKTDNNPAQFVKALVHKIKYIMLVEEDSLVKSINDIRTERDKAVFPQRQILNSLLAEIVWQYYQNNRYVFYNRTQTEAFKQDDLRTWDLRKIVEECVSAYSLSLTEADRLKTVPIDTIKAILTADPSMVPNGRERRPTLYDFLAHRAVDFFIGQEPDITRPAETFVLNDERYLGTASEFSKLTLVTKDPLAYKYHALAILKELTLFHANDKTPFALVDIDLKRLDFVKSHSVMGNKDLLYLGALEKLEKSVMGSPASAEVSYRKAFFYFEKADLYKPGQAGDTKDAARTAFGICADAIKRFPDSLGASFCASMQNQIREKSLSLTLENINLPDKPFKGLVQAKNVNKIYFKIYKADRNDLEAIYDKYLESYRVTGTYKAYQAVVIDFFKARKETGSFAVDLPDDGDYNKHGVEVKLPALGAGSYAVLAGTAADLNYTGNAVTYTFTHSSVIGYINRSRSNQDMDFRLLNRQTGEPLKDATAQMYLVKYDNGKSRNQYVKSALYTADANGFFSIPAGNEYKQFAMEFKFGNDVLSVFSEGDSHGNAVFHQGYKYESNVSQDYLKAMIFTDRAIYRPGQTVYFKSILLRTNNAKKYELMKKTNAVAEFYDVNGQKVAEKKLVTNEFGSINGVFTAPSGTLTGQMYIMVKAQDKAVGYQYFSVEEYKRPKFEVIFNPLKGTYRLDDTITATVLAKAYSGALITDANVKYRVVRSAVFPYWWYYYFGYFPRSPEMEIANGAGTTNDKGEFQVTFKAIPDASVAPDSKPVFTYRIYADVTDVNGETHSQTQYVSIGYNALIVRLDADEYLNRDAECDFSIATTNLMGEYEKSECAVTIHKLKSPSKFARQRMWDKPDRFVMTRAEHSRDFPDDVYDDEDNSYKWEKETKVFGKSLSVGEQTKVGLADVNKWGAGFYLLEAETKDKYGQAVKEVKYFTLYSRKDGTAPYPMAGLFVPDKLILEPGETLSVLTSSRASQALFELDFRDKLVETRYLKFANPDPSGRAAQSVALVPIKEEYRGNITLYYTFVANNRLYPYSQTIMVPYTNKQLSIVFETFRSKLAPGEKEEWRLKVTGPDKEKFTAEMVATLYDASLDAFRPNYFGFSLYDSYYGYLLWQSTRGFTGNSSYLYETGWNPSVWYDTVTYDTLNWFDVRFYDRSGRFRGSLDGDDMVMMKSSETLPMTESGKKDGAPAPKPETARMEEKEKKPNEPLAQNQSQAGDNQAGADFSDVKIRTNFNETAFFYPALYTDEKGEIIISFTVPEALTRWKMLGLAHTQDLKYGLVTNQLVTQKDLMVVPNPPRFFREGDTIAFSSKISNVSENDLSGDVRLELFDSVSMKALDLIGTKDTVQKFTVKKGANGAVKWKFKIPDSVQAITYRIAAKTGTFSDGEEQAVPVLTNRMLVTESLPLNVSSSQKKEFKLEKLLTNTSKTLKNHKLTLEFTTNPVWYAIQALPYIMEYPYECAEQLFNRFYANSLSTHIVNKKPKIKKVFDTWRDYQKEAFLSNLDKNPELKSLILEETPWVMDAKDESERKKMVAVLFDLNRMSLEKDNALKKLAESQYGNGGWPWFKGMPDSPYITLYIVSGMGHLKKLGVDMSDRRIGDMMRKAIPYMDRDLLDSYLYLKSRWKADKIDMSKNRAGNFEILYYYARSFFTDIPVQSDCGEAFEFYKWHIKNSWKDYAGSRYFAGMIALALSRIPEETPKEFQKAFTEYGIKDFAKKGVPAQIIKSLKEYALYSEEMGMYWKQSYGWYWYELPIETQALMCEVFTEVAKDTESVDKLKTWLLKQKQTQNWSTTKATGDAIYALLYSGGDWAESQGDVEIKVGKVTIDALKSPELKAEAGTGYFKTSWNAESITPDMGNVTVTKKDKGIAWGSLYWQYFENLDKITPHETPLKLAKKLFLVKDSATGPVLSPITEKTNLKPGDKVKVRIELRVDRDMEYVHMKDMRASCFEPVNVISRYKYQDGLGYYESTRDAATNFFIDYLPKGTFVFEYPLFVTHTGDFSNGVTTIQCMYAPEFTSHSEGIRVTVGE